MKRLLTLSAAAVFLAAISCSPSSPEPSADDTEQREDAVSSRSASVGSVTITLQGASRFEERDGARVLVVKGSANRNLESIFSWVPDDAFGEASLITQRKFEVVLRDGHEINSVLSGLPLNLSLVAKSGATREAYARIVLAPSFARFSGSTSLYLDKTIRPVFVASDEDSLRYRGRVEATSPVSALTADTEDGADPVATRIDERAFQLDWQYAAFASAADPHTDPVVIEAALTNGSTKTKRADIDVLVTELDLTTDDPYNAWPTPLCEEAVYDCVKDVRNASGTDFGACGDYREVSRCAYATHCEFEPPAEFALEPFDATDEIDPALGSYNASCPQGGTWCSVSRVSTYNVPACLPEPATLAQALDYLRATEQGFVEGGSFLDRAGLETTSLFSSTYSSGGPGLLLAIDVTTGGGPVEAYVATTEVPCHNCTDFADYAVLFYPLSQTTVVVEASHGYDS